MIDSDLDSKSKRKEGTDWERLLFAADYYDLQNIKTVCVEELKSGISVANAIDLLCLGDAASQESLKPAAMQFIAGMHNTSKVRRTKEWVELRKNNAKLFKEVKEYCDSFRISNKSKKKRSKSELNEMVN